LLGAYPLVRRFAESVVLPRFPALAGQVRSLLMCCRVLDLLQDSKGGVGDADVVGHAIQNHLRTHQAVYGEQRWRPKMHYALHFAEQLRRDGRLYDCFVVERSHQTPKALASSVKNTTDFERSLLARSVLVRLRRLEEWAVGSGLQGPSQAFPQLAREAGEVELRIASKGVLSGMLFALGDILLCAEFIIEVAAFVDSGRLGVLGRLLEVVARPTTAAVECRRQPSLSLLWTAGLRARRPHAWVSLASDHILLLVRDAAP